MLGLFVKSGWTVNENNTLHFHEACYLKVLKDFINYVNKPPSPPSSDILTILEMSISPADLVICLRVSVIT